MSPIMHATVMNTFFGYLCKRIFKVEKHLILGLSKVNFVIEIMAFRFTIFPVKAMKCYKAAAS